MVYLLVDNSNSRTKFILSDAYGFVSERRVMNTADLKPEAIAALLYDWVYELAVICSVVPSARPALEDGIAAPCHFLAWDSPHGIDLSAYPDREHLGADRLANVLAMRERGAGASIAIDLGTAITYDVLEEREGNYYFLGGVIAPGLAAIRHYLSSKTALLPEVDLDLPAKMIAQNTCEAMQVGILIGFKGMIQETIAQLCAELDQKPEVVATGGDAALAAQLVEGIDACCDDLTLSGLRGFASRLDAGSSVVFFEKDTF